MQMRSVTSWPGLTFPEVVSVHGKIGRADSATDPAPLSMIETVVQLSNDPADWRTRRVG